MRKFTLFIIGIFLLITILPAMTSAEKISYSLPVSDTADGAGVTNQKKFTVNVTAPVDSKLRFFVNSNTPSRILEINDFEIEMKDIYFEGSVYLSEFKYQGILGLNEVTIEITEPGKSRKNVVKYIKLDKLAPTLRLKDIPSNTNSKELRLEGYVDEPATIIAEFNGKTETVVVGDNETVDYILSLGEDGDYEITLTATDDAGNVGKGIIKTHLDTKPCTITTLEDRDKLSSEVQHFPVITLKGNTSEPNCRIKILNVDDNVKINASQVDQYLRDSLRSQSESEIGVGGLLAQYSKEINSEGNGEFKTQLALKQNLDNTQLDRQTQNNRRRIDEVVTNQNSLRLFIFDQAGNVAEDSLNIRYEPGSSFWKLRGVKTLPNTVYSSNLFAEQSNGVEVSVMYDLVYLGPSKNELKNPTVSVSPDGNLLDNDHISIGEVFSHYYPEEGRLFVLAKLRIHPNSQNVKELKDKISGNEIGNTGSGLQIDFALTNVVSFNVGAEAYTNEQVFLKHAVGVETPFEYTKYLTPEMLDKAIKDIESINKGLVNAVDIADKVTLVMTGACFAKSAFDLVAGASDSSLKATFAICDRVWCPSIPPACQNVKKVGYGEDNTRYIFDEDSDRYLDDDGNVLDGNPSSVIFEQEQDGQKSTYRWIDKHDICNDPAEPHAIEIRNTEKNKGGIIIGGESLTSVTSTSYDCTSFTKDGYAAESARSAAIGCYNPEAPSFDDMKCWPGSAESVSQEGGANTYDDILISSRCGCVSGIRTHLTNTLRISEGFKKCLQQAQIGEVSGGYCERLFAQFTCDLVAWGIEKGLGASDKKVETDLIEPPVGRYNFNQVKGKLQGRYGSVIQSRIGLPSDQLVHKSCIAAITGDWNDLEGIFRQAGRIPVKPVVGPLMPESRFTSWNPFTGEASINYYFTLGILSGGQEVTGTVKVLCDKRKQGGEFCPSDRPQLIYEENIFVQSDQSLQRNVFYEDQKAKYWGNVVILELSYLEGDQQKHTKVEEIIVKKNNLLAQCSFRAPNIGITCETVSGGLVAAEFKDATLSPNVQTFYPGQDVYVKTLIDGKRPSLLKDGSSDDVDLYLTYNLKTPLGNVEDNSQSLRDWKIDLENPRMKQIFFLKQFEEVRGDTAKFWSGTQTKLIQPFTLGAQGSSYSSVEVKGEDITSLVLWDNSKNRKIDCEKELGIYSCKNERSNEFEVLYITYVVNAGDKTEGSLSFNYFDTSGSLQNFDFDLGQPKSQTGAKPGTTGRYTLNLSLYHDVNRDGIIDKRDTHVPFGHSDGAQTKLIYFDLKGNPQSCSQPPSIDIIYPNQDALVTKDLRTSLTKEGGVEFTMWDDCSTPRSNEIKNVMLFDSKSLERARTEAKPLKDKNEIETIYRKYAISDIFPTLDNQKKVYIMKGDLKYQYNDQERFELIVRATDHENNAKEESLSVTKSGGHGFVSATPVEIEQCRLKNGGVCEVSCDPGQRDQGSCGDGRCCG
jgi:hypothetical protein